MTNHNFTASQKYASEFIGTAFLLATVVGSGIMAENLAGGNVAIALLGNALATGAILIVLITMIGPISGAHFNPAVTLIFFLKKQISIKDSVIYVAAQIIGGLLGVVLAHIMFDLELIQFSTKMRSSPALWSAELIATFGLLFTILATLHSKAEAVAMAVGLYITAAYWFAASTSFANPAVTIARGFSDSFAGINPAHILAFIVAQITGAVLAYLFCNWLFSHKSLNN